MAIQSRENALQGEYVRLYHVFDKDGLLFDPPQPPVVQIVSSNYNTQSTSSTSSTSFSLSTSSTSSESVTSSASEMVPANSNEAVVGVRTTVNIVIPKNIITAKVHVPGILETDIPYFDTNEIQSYSINATKETLTIIASAINPLSSRTIRCIVYIGVNLSANDDEVVSEDGFGYLVARRESSGVWYVDWFVPDNLTLGPWYDIWTFQWVNNGVTETSISEFQVFPTNTEIFWTSPTISTKISDSTAQMINDLTNNFLYEAQHIPVYGEQGYPYANDNRTFNFARNNWRKDPRPVIRVNKTINNNWSTDFNGIVRFNYPLDPEDVVLANYQFRYFSNEEMLDFLVAGMLALNSVAPVSEYYTNIANAPFYWQYGIILYAAITGIQRLIYGLNFQEKAVIFGDNWDVVNAKIANLSKIYADYSKTWDEFAKDIKTNKLPQIAQISVPEYTLPGGGPGGSVTSLKGGK